MQAGDRWTQRTSLMLISWVGCAMLSNIHELHSIAGFDNADGVRSGVRSGMDENATHMSHVRIVSETRAEDA